LRPQGTEKSRGAQDARVSDGNGNPFTQRSGVKDCNEQRGPQATPKKFLP